MVSLIFEGIYFHGFSENCSFKEIPKAINVHCFNRYTGNEQRPKKPTTTPHSPNNFFLFVQALQVKCYSIDKISALLKRFINNTCITQISNHDWKKGSKLSNCIPFFKSTDLPTSLCLENSVFKLLFFNKIFVGGGDGEELGATENDDDNRGDNEPLREQASRFTI